MSRRPPLSAAPRRVLARRAGLVTLAIFAFALGAYGVRLWTDRRLGPIEVEVLSAKLAAFDARADEITHVFVGSSRVFRQISPRIFDASLGEHGVSSRSFNLGAPAMLLVEEFDVVRRIVAGRPERLEVVFVEPSFEFFHGWANVRSTRAVAIFDAPNTRDYVQRMLHDPIGPLSKASRIGAALLSCSYNLTNAGRLRGVVVPKSSSVDAREVLGPDGDGFVSLDRLGGVEFEERRSLFLASEDRFRANVAALRGGAPGVGSNTDWLAFARGMLEDFSAEMERAGISVVYVLPPGAARGSEADALAATGARELPTLSFLSPSAYPELYDHALWFDLDHLGADGAAIFTRELAGAFLALSSERESG